MNEVCVIKQQLSAITEQLDRLQRSMDNLLAKHESAKQKEIRPVSKKKLHGPVRDGADYGDLCDALAVVEQSGVSKFIKARQRVCFVLLFGTGLRVSNLLLLTVNHFRQLLDTEFETLTIKLVKTRKLVVQKLMLRPLSRKLLKTELRKDVDCLLYNKKMSEYVITQQRSNEAISRCKLTRELNEVLTKLGQKKQKVLKTHSFRIGFITDIIQVSSMDTAKMLANHSSVSTTAGYNRRVLNKEQINNLLSAADGLHNNKEWQTNSNS